MYPTVISAPGSSFRPMRTTDQLSSGHTYRVRCLSTLSRGLQPCATPYLRILSLRAPPRMHGILSCMHRVTLFEYVPTHARAHKYMNACTHARTSAVSFKRTCERSRQLIVIHGPCLCLPPSGSCSVWAAKPVRCIRVLRSPFCF